MSASSASASSPRHRGFQFSLVTLLVVMGWVAVVCIAMRTPTPLWSGISFTLTLAIVLTSLLATIYRYGRQRAFAAGFLLFSVAYAGCLYFMEVQLHQGRNNGVEMPTSRASNWLYQQLHKDSTRTVTDPSGGTGGMGGMGGGMGGGGYGGGGMFSVDSGGVTSDETSAVPDSDADAEDDEPDVNPDEPTDVADSEDGSYGGEAAMGMPSGGSMMGPGGGYPSGYPGMPGMSGMPGSGSMMPGMMPGQAGAYTYQVALYDVRHFEEILHSSLTVLFGIVGGVIGQLLYVTRREEKHEARISKSETSTKD
jgi:hypothetical protein